MTGTPAREALEKWLTKRHPSDVRKRLDAYRDEVRREDAELLRAAAERIDTDTARGFYHHQAALQCANFIDPDRKD